MKRTCKITAALLALVMILLALPTAFAAEESHVLDTTTDLTAFAQGDKADGEAEVIGDYFTIYYSSKTKIDQTSGKTWGTEEDDYYMVIGSDKVNRLNLGGKTTWSDEYVVKNAIAFTTAGDATVKIWGVSGDAGRNIAVQTDAETVVATYENTTEKNATFYAELPVTGANTYYICLTEGNNYILKVEVVEAAAEATTPEETEPETTVPEQTEDGVLEIYAGNEAYTGWANWPIQINTTNWGGAVNPGFITEGGYLSVYCTGSDIWSVHLALNSPPSWVQFDRDISTATQLDDGSYVFVFTYEELVAAYGSDFSPLGAIQIASNCADTGSVTITRVTYTAATEEEPPVETQPVETQPVETQPVETQPVETEKKPGDNGILVLATCMMLASAAAVVALTTKKRAF